MSKKKIWLQKQKKDPYYRKSKQQGHRARSYYKLEQIDQKFNIFKINGRNPRRILDLGAAPGAWLEYIRDLYLKRPETHQTKKFKAIGIDLTTIRPFPDFPYIQTFRVDIFKPKCEEILSPFVPFDVILSDLAPKTSGDFRDAAIQSAMVEKVLEFTKFLKPHGNVVIKVFQSEETNALFREGAGLFQKFKRTKPAASRESSREIYFIGLNYLGKPKKK
ncbi:MAG: SAM-dependent methyltransferase [Promethearchaeota archaeon]